jgi:hypothetical protein
MDWTIFELLLSFKFVKNIQKYTKLLKWFLKNETMAKVKKNNCNQCVTKQ